MTDERCTQSHPTLGARCEYLEDGHWRHRSRWRDVVCEWGARTAPDAGRQRVIDVFGDDCPVCSHSVTGAHDHFWRCQLCGVQCGTHPWPPASVERFRAAQHLDDTKGQR